MPSLKLIVTLLIIAVAVMVACDVYARFPRWFARVARVRLIGTMLRVLLACQAFSVVGVGLMCLRIGLTADAAPGFDATVDGLYLKLLGPVAGGALVSLAWCVFLERVAFRKAPAQAPESDAS